MKTSSRTKYNGVRDLLEKEKIPPCGRNDGTNIQNMKTSSRTKYNGVRDLLEKEKIPPYVRNDGAFRDFFS